MTLEDALEVGISGAARYTLKRGAQTVATLAECMNIYSEACEVLAEHILENKEQPGA